MVKKSKGAYWTERFFNLTKENGILEEGTKIRWALNRCSLRKGICRQSGQLAVEVAWS
jgi:hypothetical protein